MAKQLNYTHPNGTNYPESYWRIAQLIVDVPALYAKFVFHGHKDAAARLSGKDPIGERTIHIYGQDFATWFAEVTGKIKNPQEVGYLACINYKDISVVEDVIVDEGLETEHTEQQVVLHSFFENAIDV
jgi:predicted ester cyclase